MRFFADTIGMFLRSKNRFKDGKQHRYWSIVENRRVADGRVVQRQVLYLGEINDSQKGRTLFGVRFDVLLYDLTSTYFESEPPQHGKRKYGYSRDKRPDCVQVVIALIVTPDGLPWSVAFANPCRAVAAMPALIPGQSLQLQNRAPSMQ